MSSVISSQPDDNKTLLYNIIDRLPVEKLPALIQHAQKLIEPPLSATNIREADARYEVQTEPSLFNKRREALPQMSAAEMREERAFKRLHSELKKQFPGDFVAIHNELLVDHDPDFASLNKRIRQNYQDQFVWIAPVLEAPEETWTVLSPQLSQP